MPKQEQQSTFPSFEEWTPPWEKNGTEFDADMAAKHVYKQAKSLHILTAKAGEREAELTAELETERTARAEAETKVTTLEDEKITDEAEKRRVQDDRRWERIEAALLGKGKDDEAGGNDGSESEISDSDRRLVAMRAGLDEEDAGRLRGSTLDELKADAEAYAKRLGINSEADLGDDGESFGYDGDSDDGGMPSGVPALTGRRTNLGGGGDGGRGVDPAKVRDLIPRR